MSKLIQTAFLVVLLIASHSNLIAQELPRSTLLGILPEQSDSNEGVTLQRIVPNSTASQLGLNPGDIVLHINEQPTPDFGTLIGVIRPLKSGADITVEISRAGKTLALSGVMQPRPYEISEYAEVLYETVSYEGHQLRSITYKPQAAKAGQKLPAVFFIQGYTCGSIDMGMMPEATSKQLLEQFAAAGYVVYRVEKPGVGDSQSTQHCSDIDFTTENKAFMQGLKKLKQKAYVNPEQVYLWGHSLGVLHSAVVANQEAVAGIIGYGGVAKSWYDYMLDIYQQQSVKHFGVAHSQASSNAKIMKPVLNMWLNTDMDWQKIMAHQATKAAMANDLLVVNGEQIFDRHYRFFRDLNQYDFASYWQQLDVPILMMHGSLDIQAISKDWAFDLVKLAKNPKSMAVEIPGAEHAFMRYDSQADYQQARASRAFNPAQPGDNFDSRIAEKTLSWLKKVTPQIAQYSGINHLTYSDDNPEKPFVGNGFLVKHKGKIYALTVKHALLEAKTPAMNSVSINGHISDWRIYPNHKPEQYVKLGKLLNEAKDEAIDMKILSKDWLIFEVLENQSDLEVLSLRTVPLEPGEKLTAFGCSYSNKDICTQDEYQGQFISATATNLRVAMPDLDLSQLRGLSGSPVLDSQQQVVGIVSNVLPSESGQGFDFAPASLDYLLAELDKLSTPVFEPLKSK